MATGTIKKQGAMTRIYSNNSGASQGTYNLADSVQNYDFLIVLMLHNGGNTGNSFITCNIPVPSIASGSSYFCSLSGNSGYFEYAKIDFPSNTKIAFTASNGNWSAPKLSKVYGVKV